MNSQKFSQLQKPQANRPPLRHQTSVVPIKPRHVSYRDDLVSDG
ncbi:hypothetical protein ACQ4N7_25850 [Nodosilinea sp. AN01ver1]